APNREADGVIASDSGHQGAAIGDLSGNLRHAPMAEVDVAAGHEHVAAIGHSNTIEVVTLSLDVEPARARPVRFRLTKARSRRTGYPRPGIRTRADERDDHALIPRHPDEPDLGFERVEVIADRRAKEGPGRGADEGLDAQRSIAPEGLSGYRAQGTNIGDTDATGRGIVAGRRLVCDSRRTSYP